MVGHLPGLAELTPLPFDIHCSKFQIVSDQPMRRFYITALIICLLLAQSALLAHELDHAEHGDSHACEYCALSGSLDKPVGDVSFSFCPQAVRSELQSSDRSHIDVRAPAFSARAPPFFS